MKLKSPTSEPVHVGLLSGEAISIGPEGRDVPKQFRASAFTQGCVPVGMDVEEIGEKVAEPTEQGRPELLKAALKKMKDEHAPLTGAGLPNRKTVSDTVGWPVTAVELTDAWNSLEP